jgi:hypothetical protein
VLGGLQLREIQDQVEVLDELYAQLRRCRRLCGGRPGLVDHRPVGQARLRPDGEPDRRDGLDLPHPRLGVPSDVENVTVPPNWLARSTGSKDGQSLIPLLQIGRLCACVLVAE